MDGIDLLEAKATLDKLEGDIPLQEGIVLTSIAISLKRIADQLAMMNQNTAQTRYVQLNASSEIRIKT